MKNNSFHPIVCYPLHQFVFSELQILAIYYTTVPVFLGQNSPIVLRVLFPFPYLVLLHVHYLVQQNLHTNRLHQYHEEMAHAWCDNTEVQVERQKRSRTSKTGCTSPFKVDKWLI